VLRFLELPAGREPSARVSGLLDALLPEARAFAMGRGGWRRLPMHEARELLLEAPAEARALVLGLVTAGAAFEARAHAETQAGRITAALLWEALGSEAAEEAADRLCADLLCEEPAVASYACRLSPGYAPWPLEAQARLFARLPHAEIGVTLAPSFLMMPRKSISFALFLDARGQPMRGAGGCARCVHPSCRGRRSRREAAP
jgi:hypothetical protein